MNESTAIVRTGAQLERVIERARERALHFLADDRAVEFTVDVLKDSLSKRQRRFFHGPLLRQISEQVRIDGRRFMPAVWKAYLKDRILEAKPRWREVKIPGEAELRLVRDPWSTEELDCPEYSRFIDQCLAIAATEWGVQFRFLVGERDGVRYVAPKRKKVAEPEEQPC